MYRRVVVAMALVACGSHSKATPDAGADVPRATYTVGGTVTGLVSTGLVLAINAGDALPIPADGPFTFSMPIATHAPYHITVMTQPAGERCDIAGGDGVIEDADVTTVAVTCHGTAVDLASDGASACSIRMDGTLWCWGEFEAGTMALRPTQIGTDTDWASLVSPYCALKTDHSVWCWRETSPPAPFDTNHDWIDVSIDWWSLHTCGIRAGGTLWCTGSTALEQHGVADAWLQVATSGGGDCAIRSDHTLWCEGDNMWGELGVGDTAPHTGLVQVGTELWKRVSTGPNHRACAIRSDDTLWCWGDNSQHDIDSTDTQEITTPEQRSTGAWTDVTFGLLQQCAVATDGTAWCWGNNSYGELGVGDMDAHVGLVQVTAPATWIKVEAGNESTCGLAADHTVWCWGMSRYGVFGDGDGSEHMRDVPGIVP